MLPLTGLLSVATQVMFRSFGNFTPSKWLTLIRQFTTISGGISIPILLISFLALVSACVLLLVLVWRNLRPKLSAILDSLRFSGILHLLALTNSTQIPFWWFGCLKPAIFAQRCLADDFEITNVNCREIRVNVVVSTGIESHPCWLTIF